MRNQKRPKKSSKKRVRLRKGDKVQVISGDQKGKGPSEVMRLLASSGRVVVQGINVRKKHLRKSQDNPQGGVTEVENPIDVSKVLLYSEKLQRGVRVRYEVRDGKKVRVGIPCGTVFDS